MTVKAPPKRPKPNPLPLPRPRDTTRELHHKVDRSQYSPQIPKKRPRITAIGPVELLKLGKDPAKHDARTLCVSDLLIKPQLPAPGPFDWDDKVPDDMGMMGNDLAGNCTVAAYGHLEQVQGSASGLSSFVPTPEDMIAMYRQITLEVNGRGYDPKDPSTDTGLALLDVLKWLRKNGLIGAFAKLRHDDRAEIEVSGKLFGGLYTGAMLPTDAQRQLGKLWTPTAGTGGDAGGWGGHAMYVSQADNDGMTYVTWAKRQRASYAWVAKYADEMYVVIDKAWVTGDRPAPSGFDLKKLQQYLAAL